MRSKISEFSKLFLCLCTTLWSVRSLVVGFVSSSQYFDIIRIMDIENNSVLGLITTLQDCFLSSLSFVISLVVSGVLELPFSVVWLSNYLTIVLLLCFLQTDGRTESNNGYPHAFEVTA